MKKNLILTSLAAIVATTAANAASDVAFSGWSETLKQDVAALAPDEKGVVHVDATAIKTDYEIKIAKLAAGDIVLDEDGKIVYETQKLDSATEVTAGRFAYFDASGHTKVLGDPNTDGKFDEEAIEYKSGDLAWNTVLKKSDYEFSYTTDAGRRVDTNLAKGAWTDRTENYNLLTALKTKDAEDRAAAEDAGTEYNSFLANISVSDSVVKIKNGEAGENNTKYAYTASNGNKYHLNAAGNGLLNEQDEKVTLGNAVEEEAIKAALTTVEGYADALLTARTQVSTEDGGTKLTADEEAWKAAYETELGTYDADQETIDDLKLAKNSRDDAIESYKNAVKDQKEKAAIQKDKIANADALAQEAYDLYNAPILETVNGAADRALDAARDYADEGDARTLQQANDYTDAKAAATLKSANAYTDKKVDALEKNVSGGVAAATALSAVEVSNVKKGEMSVGAGYGYYNGQSAAAFGTALGISDSWSVNAGAGIAQGDKTQFSIRAGANYKFKLF